MTDPNQYSVIPTHLVEKLLAERGPKERISIARWEAMCAVHAHLNSQKVGGGVGDGGVLYGAPLNPTLDEIETFEKWAKTAHCNLERSPYPQNYSTYRVVRTQHLFEGVLIGLRSAKRPGGPVRVLFQEERAALREANVGDAPLPPVYCDMPPEGWLCMREAGHPGPCAANKVIAPRGSN